MRAEGSASGCSADTRGCCGSASRPAPTNVNGLTLVSLVVHKLLVCQLRCRNNHSFVHNSFGCALTYSFVRSFIRSFVRSFARSLVHSFVRLFVRLFDMKLSPRVRYMQS